MGSIQKVHGQTAEPQVLVGADWVGNVSVGRMAFFIAESINGHGKKLHAILKIIIYMCGRSSIYVQLPFSKRFRSGLDRKSVV